MAERVNLEALLAQMNVQVRKTLVDIGEARQKVASFVDDLKSGKL